MILMAMLEIFCGLLEFYLVFVMGVDPIFAVFGAFFIIIGLFMLAGETL